MVWSKAKIVILNCLLLISIKEFVVTFYIGTQQPKIEHKFDVCHQYKSYWKIWKHKVEYMKKPIYGKLF